MKDEKFEKRKSTSIGGLAIILIGEGIAIPAGVKAMDSLCNNDYSTAIGYGSLALGGLIATSLGFMSYFKRP